MAEERQIDNWKLNYQAVQKTLDPIPNEERAALLQRELPPCWNDIYEEISGRTVELYRLTGGAFEYIYDNQEELADHGKTVQNDCPESRLVAAFGRSAPSTILRRHDDQRLKGWLGPTEKSFGKDFDKGHFIAHSIGGAVDRAEYNVFIQCRRLNRGWTSEGKIYRQMEDYCRLNEGVFCFSRPFYSDGSSRPTWLEFGVLRTDGTLWLEVFDNRGGCGLSPA